MSRADEDIMELSNPQKRHLLAQYLLHRKERKQEDSNAALPSVVPEPTQRYTPFSLTDIQQAYWIGRGSTFGLGNVSTHLYLEIDCIQLDVARLNDAWQQVIECHEMLRAVVEANGQQKILEYIDHYRIATTDLREKNADEVQEIIEGIRARLSHQVLPANRWPLFEISATLLNKECTRLHISIDLLFLDGASLMLLFHDWVRIYHHPETILTRPPLSFRDYVQTMEILRQSELYQRSLAYWKKQAPLLPSAPELPLVCLPDMVQHPHFIHRSTRLSSGEWQQLKSRATTLGLTPSTVLLAVYAEVLATWSKSPRFTLNVTLFNRLAVHPNVNEIVGDFTSTILLNVDCHAEEPFVERIKKLQRQLWTDLEHRCVSGIEVMRSLAQDTHEYSGIRMPVVFTSFLNLAQQGFHSLFTSWRMLGNVVYQVFQTPQVWLDYQVHEDGEDLIITWDAVEKLFPSGLLDDMFTAHHMLLARLAQEDTDWYQVMLSLVPTAQCEQRAYINATDAPICEELLHTLFIKQLSAHSNQEAVVASNRTLSYEELYRYANRVGHHLQRLGTQPNTLVAIVMEKGWEQVVAALGILNAGAAYLHVDPTLPQDRVWYMLEHGKVDIVLTQSWIDAQLEWPESYTRLCIDHGESVMADDSPLDSSQTALDLAYVIYTSGSTGLPKGVMIDHRGAVNTIVDVNQRFSVTSNDRILALSSLSFDLSVYDLFGSLAVGAALILPDVSYTRDPAHWLQLIEREQITIWNSVPALLEMLVDYVENTGCVFPPSLRLVLLSGDWIPLSLPQRIWKLTRTIRVISLGGATEASIWSILYPIETIDPTWKSIPYGKPMVNQHMYVLNDVLEPCPVMVPGQLYIGGIGLALGYWKDEEKTHNSFLLHPRSGERLYRTGDLGRYMSDGNIEFLGRVDLQVKIQGYRIELGEIETLLEQHSQIQMAVVTAMSDPRESKHLVAYIVPKQKQISSADSVSSHNKGISGDFYDALQDTSVIHNPLERMQFKLSQPGLRRGTEKKIISLEKPEEISYSERIHQCYRYYQTNPIPLQQFTNFLNTLSQTEVNASPKYRYPSAGGSYPIQVYLFIKPGRISGIDGGYYYYHPRDHQLWLLSDEVESDRTIHAEHNRFIFDGSAFSLFLIGSLDAIKPMYGELARDFCLLEAGYMSQLLMGVAPTYEIGLCPIGALDFSHIRHLLSLDDNHIFVHCLLGGRIDPSLQQCGLSNGVYEGSQKDIQRTCSLTDELELFLQTKLPRYMVPSIFVTMEALPLSSNGKVDRRALPAPDWSNVQQHDTFVPPRTTLERTLATILADVLMLEKVGIHDNFFALGGNSLSAMRAVLHIREALQENFAIRDIFERPSIAELATVIENQSVRQPSVEGTYQTKLTGEHPQDQQMYAENGEELVAHVKELPLIKGELSASSVVTTLHPEGAALSFAQQRLWFLDQLIRNEVPYNMPTALRLVGPLDYKIFEHGIQEIIKRHESLRMSVKTVDSQPTQVISSSLSLSLPSIDLTHFEQEEQETVIRHLIRKEVLCAFDLTHTPLFRVSLFRLADKEHLFLLTVHHIIADGWSMGIFCRELVAYYEAFLSSKSVALPQLSMSYLDYVVWQKKHYQGATLEKLLSFWRKQLEGTPHVLNLLTDRPRPPVQTYRGAQCSLEVSPELTLRLKALSRQENASLFMTLLAAFQIVLYRYSGQKDMLIGCPVANRSLMEVQNLIGCFANTLILRGKLFGNPTFLELLSRVRANALDAYAHQDLPFEQLVEALQPQRDLSRNPLFQVMFLLQDEPLPATDIGNLSFNSIYLERGGAQVDLTLTMVDVSNTLHAYLEYNSDLFEEGTIQRLLTHLQRVLEEVVADRQQRIETFSLVTPVERQQMVEEWNATTVPDAPLFCVHQLIEVQVHRSPDAIALTSDEHHLSYEVLDAQSHLLAGELQAEGVGPEVVVGVCLERSLELPLAFLAVLKAGGAYLPLDPDYPEQRLALLLADAQPLLVLSQQRLRNRLPATGHRVVCLDDPLYQPRQAKGSTSARTDSLVTADNLCYVIYTSGSTGMPKGTMNTHRGLCNRLWWMQQECQLTCSDRVLQKTPFSFDVSVWELLWPLLVGARLVMAPPASHRDSRQLIEVMRQQQVTLLHFVPAMLRVFLEDADARQCSDVRMVICSGEALTPEVQARFFALFAARLLNLYGPTEASIDVSYWHCQREWPVARRVPIGRPIANTQLYVLGAQQQLVPIGVVGEVYIGGSGLGRGYRDQPVLTAERFVPHGWATQVGERLYRTGDLGRYREDGAIEFLGRSDDQVKVRGVRIEPGEIEVVLKQHPRVAEAVVVVREEREGEQRVVGYVVAKGREPLSQRNLREHVQKRLPEYLVPAIFVMLEALPLTANGKVDRRALPLPDGVRPDLEIALEMPRTTDEQIIAAIWQDLLQIKQVGIDDNFFDLGGHSLLAFKVLSKLKERGKRELSILDFFKYPTVRTLAAYLAEEETTSSSLVKSIDRAKMQRTAIARRGFVAKERKSSE